MKNNRTTRLIIFILALTMITIMIVSGTYAKYTSSAKGSDTATVAKWSIELGGAEIATGSEKTIAIDLFSTIKDSDSTTETDVAGTKKIAPGTRGEFDIAIQNKSEVTAEYKLTSTVTKSDDTLPIEFSTDGGTTWSSTLAIPASNSTKLAVGSAAATVNVQWRWAFYVSDAADTVDTQLGINARGGDGVTIPNVTIEVTVTATQVD